MPDFPLPQRVQESFERRRQATAARLDHGCGAGTAEGQKCDKRPAVPYPRGWRCSEHAPPEQPVDPERTLTALRDKAGIRPDAMNVGRTVLDARAEDSGRRVSSARRAAARGTVGGDQ